MAIDVSLRDIQSGYLTATAFTENNTLIEQALAKAIDRNGGANNEMLADLDMGTNDILNVGTIDATSVTANGTAGVSGSFTTADSKTVTVTGGLITSIV